MRQNIKTFHNFFYKSAKDMRELPDASVQLIVTSPPYPMIEMWDEIFIQQDPNIRMHLAENEGRQAFELMHAALLSIWQECARVLCGSGICCINVGDATRTLNGVFQLYTNHAKVIEAFQSLGLSSLPCILWRKQTNAPNKFMGSGMLPPGAYVTLEHEYILIFRKGGKREFKTKEEKLCRAESAYFWGERNQWFSDVWMDLKGTGQAMKKGLSRTRSAAYPLELAYRLVNMFSVMQDTVLDPFAGTGTTALAAALSGRNSQSYEIDKGFRSVVTQTLLHIPDVHKSKVATRLNTHKKFMAKRAAARHANKGYGLPVVTSQERELILPVLRKVTKTGMDEFTAEYK
jgi:modification methylase